MAIHTEEKEKLTMNKTEALDLICHAIDCYVEDCIKTAPKSETRNIWKAFRIIENVVERSIKERGDADES